MQLSKDFLLPNGRELVGRFNEAHDPVALLPSKTPFMTPPRHLADPLMRPPLGRPVLLLEKHRRPVRHPVALYVWRPSPNSLPRPRLRSTCRQKRCLGRRQRWHPVSHGAYRRSRLRSRRAFHRLGPGLVRRLRSWCSGPTGRAPSASTNKPR